MQLFIRYIWRHYAVPFCLLETLEWSNNGDTISLALGKVDKIICTSKA